MGRPSDDPNITRRPRPPILDDLAYGVRMTNDVWVDDDPHDTAASRRYWMDQCQEQLAVTQQLRSDLSAARYERDIWWPLAFGVGVLCGMGLTYVV